MDDTVFRVVAGVIAVFAVAVGLGLLVAVTRSRSVTRAASRGRRYPAVVVDNQQHSWQDGRLSFSPVVRFRDAGGTERTLAATDSSSDSWIAGTELEVLVGEERPDVVLLAGDRAAAGRGFGSGFGIVVALVFLAMGVGVWVFFGAQVAGGPWWAGPFGHPPDTGTTDFPFDGSFPGS